MWIQVGADWRPRKRVPHHQHRVFSTVCSHNPALVFIFRAGSCCDPVAVPRQQSESYSCSRKSHLYVLMSRIFPILKFISRRRPPVSYSPLISGQVVDALIYVLVEAEDVLEVLQEIRLIKRLYNRTSALRPSFLSSPSPPPSISSP